MVLFACWQREMHLYLSYLSNYIDNCIIPFLHIHTHIYVYVYVTRHANAHSTIYRVTPQALVNIGLHSEHTLTSGVT